MLFDKPMKENGLASGLGESKNKAWEKLKARIMRIMPMDSSDVEEERGESPELQYIEEKLGEEIPPEYEDKVKELIQSTINQGQDEEGEEDGHTHPVNVSVVVHHPKKK